MLFHKKHIITAAFFFFLSLNLYPATAEAAKAYLDIVSKPVGVEVFIGGNYIGKTPVSGVEVESGRVTVFAKKTGYGTATRELMLKPDSVTILNIQLNPAREETGKRQDQFVIEQDKGQLILINKLGMDNVFIDGQNKGAGSLKLTDISTGSHNLQVASFSKKITIYKDYTLKVMVTSEGIKVLNDKSELDEIKGRKDEERREKRKKLEDRQNQLAGLKREYDRIWEECGRESGYGNRWYTVGKSHYPEPLQFWKDCVRKLDAVREKYDNLKNSPLPQ